MATLSSLTSYSFTSSVNSKLSNLTNLTHFNLVKQRLGWDSYKSGVLLPDAYEGATMDDPINNHEDTSGQDSSWVWSTIECPIVGTNTLSLKYYVTKKGFEDGTKATNTLLITNSEDFQTVYKSAQSELSAAIWGRVSYSAVIGPKMENVPTPDKSVVLQASSSTSGPTVQTRQKQCHIFVPFELITDAPLEWTRHIRFASPTKTGVDLLTVQCTMLPTNQPGTGVTISPSNCYNPPIGKDKDKLNNVSAAVPNCTMTWGLGTESYMIKVLNPADRYILMADVICTITVNLDTGVFAWTDEANAGKECPLAVGMMTFGTGHDPRFMGALGMISELILPPMMVSITLNANVVVDYYEVFGAHHSKSTVMYDIGQMARVIADLTDAVVELQGNSLALDKYCKGLDDKLTTLGMQFNVLVQNKTKIDYMNKNNDSINTGGKIVKMFLGWIPGVSAVSDIVCSALTTANSYASASGDESVIETVDWLYKRMMNEYGTLRKFQNLSGDVTISHQLFLTNLLKSADMLSMFADEALPDAWDPIVKYYLVPCDMLPLKKELYDFFESMKFSSDDILEYTHVPAHGFITAHWMVTPILRHTCVVNIGDISSTLDVMDELIKGGNLVGYYSWEEAYVGGCWSVTYGGHDKYRTENRIAECTSSYEYKVAAPTHYIESFLSHYASNGPTYNFMSHNCQHTSVEIINFCRFAQLPKWWSQSQTLSFLNEATQKSLHKVEVDDALLKSNRLKFNRISGRLRRKKN
jgi:hypothetical protein